jgi:hypothetical protein
MRRGLRSRSWGRWSATVVGVVGVVGAVGAVGAATMGVTSADAGDVNSTVSGATGTIGAGISGCAILRLSASCGLSGLTVAGPVPQATSPAGELEGVYCTSSANCWAVGFRDTSNDAKVNEALHWTGGRWFEVAVPSAGGTKRGDISELYAVRCTSTVNCWAVGFYDTSTSELPEALHWNGKQWGEVATPGPSGTGNDQVSYLIDVGCTSAASCWAVGSHARSLTFVDSGNLMLRWNGKKWSQVTVPNPAGTGKQQVNGLDAIRCTSPADCWTGGYAGSYGNSAFNFSNEMLHWNGKKWSNTTVPHPGGTGPGSYTGVSGLSCTGPDNCWAVGIQGRLGSTSTYLNEALRWNGEKWSHVPTPEPDGKAMGANNELIGVNCANPQFCWAVGYNAGISGGIVNQVLRWTGSKWTVAFAPDPAGIQSTEANDLFGVRCVSAADCWAVGYAEPTSAPEAGEILHWNGHQWRIN